MSAIDLKALEAAARALAASDAKNGRDPNVHYSDYRENWDRMSRAAITAYLSATSSAATSRVARLEEALEQIEQWGNAYPLDVFPEPDFDKVRAALDAAGLSLGAVSASNMRHVIKRVSEIARAALGSDAG